jgi:hypothetical protein
MSRSAGPGSPVWFLCPVERVERRYGSRREHVVTLTGREKPYRPNRGSAMGLRSTFTSREYVCSCSYRGWSNHVDLAR